MSRLDVLVTARTVGADGIAVFELTSLDGAALPGFSAGSHVDVYTPSGLVRQYSLCNSPGETHRYRIAVLRDRNSRGGSAAMHDQVREGDILSIGPPRNLFALVAGEEFLLFAGGIGITPLLCMAHRLQAAGKRFRLHYCTRTPSAAAFREEIQTSSFASAVQFHFDDGVPSQRLDIGAALGSPAPGKHVYVCGPSGFIGFVETAAQVSGFHGESIHVEHFAAAPSDAPADVPFDVKVASTGAVYTVGPGVSVVQVLAAHDIDIPVSCEQGICGTCVTRVLEGQCDHRDLFLSEAEKAANGQFTPCCSRARSPLLVIDL